MSKATLALTAGGVLLAAVLTVFFSSQNSDPPAVKADPIAQRVSLLALSAETTCLSVSGSKHSSDIQVYLDQLKGGGKAESAQTQLRGATDRLQGELLKQENDSIRECMKAFIPEMIKAV